MILLLVLAGYVNNAWYVSNLDEGFSILQDST